MSWDEIFGGYVMVGEYKLVFGNLIIGSLIALGTWLFLLTVKRAMLRPRLILGKIDEKRRVSIFLLFKYCLWVMCFIIIYEADEPNDVLENEVNGPPSFFVNL